MSFLHRVVPNVHHNLQNYNDKNTLNYIYLSYLEAKQFKKLKLLRFNLCGFLKVRVRFFFLFRQDTDKELYIRISSISKVCSITKK